MMVDAIYCGKIPIERIYFGGEIVFQGNFVEPIPFQERRDGKLVILGALSAKSYSSGLYLDCEPKDPDIPESDLTWEYPIKNGNVLTITQVFNITQSGNVLEVE